jgi:hypothetical protein
MGVFELFSKRRDRARRAERGETDVFRYDAIPVGFRVQVCHILDDALGVYTQPEPYRNPAPSNESWEYIHKILCKEKAVFRLSEASDPKGQCMDRLLNGSDDDVLDIVEISFKVVRFVSKHVSPDAKRQSNVTYDADEAIEELNARFREHGLGYEFVGGEIIQKSSEFIHVEAVKPALALLRAPEFSAASTEFLSAHAHFRAGRYEEAITQAAKAFESTLKIVCVLNGWAVPAKETAQPLINTIFEQGLIPDFLKTHVEGLKSAMQGLASLGNRLGRHGAGASPRSIETHTVAFALHLAAANIVFLIHAHEAQAK